MAAPLDMEPAALSLELLPTDPLLLILSFLDYRDLMRCAERVQGREEGGLSPARPRRGAGGGAGGVPRAAGRAEPRPGGTGGNGPGRAGGGGCRWLPNFWVRAGLRSRTG